MEIEECNLGPSNACQRLNGSVRLALLSWIHSSRPREERFGLTGGNPSAELGLTSHGKKGILAILVGGQIGWMEYYRASALPHGNFGAKVYVPCTGYTGP